MKREQCPKCKKGHIRRYTTSEKPGADLERWYRECNKQCGYRDVLLVRPAKIISQERLDSRNEVSAQPV